MKLTTVTAHCPLCGGEVTVPVKITGTEMFDDGVRRSVIVKFERGDVAHRCPDPTTDNPKTAYGYPYPTEGST